MTLHDLYRHEILEYSGRVAINIEEYAMHVQTDINIRSFRWEDLPALTDLMNLCAEHDQLDGRYTLEEVEHDWHQPEYDPETECFVVHDQDNTLVAFGLTETPFERNRAFGTLIVHPDHRRSHIGEQLLVMTDQRFLDAVKDEVPEETPIFVQRWNSSQVEHYRDIYLQYGYQEARRFYHMQIDLDTPLEPPTMPEGLKLRPFDPEQDGPAVHAAIEESFRDHWGHIDVPYDAWKRHRLEEPAFDPTMWFIAYEGDEVAGVSLCRRWGDDTPELAWLGTLGVRRPWRKRGLGMALLKHSFYVFQQRGYTLGGLGVDSDSKTNALALYERAGMSVHKIGIVYRRVMRGDANAIPD
jgi:mycothiol synthase